MPRPMRTLKFWMFGVVAVCFSGVAQAGTVKTESHTFPSLGSDLGPEINVSEPLIGTMYIAGYIPYENPAETLACTNFSVPNQFLDKIVLIERDFNCTFQDKIFHAQLAGAKGVIVFNREFNLSLIHMGGDPDSLVYQSLHIPSVFVSRESGVELIQAFLSVYNATNEGLSVAISVVEGEYYGSGRNTFLGANYTTLGIIYGVIMAASVLYWILFCAWRYNQITMRTRAIKLLKRVKYSPQTIPQILEGNQEHGGHAILTAASTTVETDKMNDFKLQTSASKLMDEKEGRDIEMSSIPIERSETLDDEKNMVESIVNETIVPSSAKVSTGGMSTLANVITRKQKKKKKATNASLFDSGNCTICLEDLVLDDEVIILPCRHIFHPDCVTRRFWMYCRNIL